MAMIDAAAEGRLQGLHVIGFDLLASLPQAQVTRRALAKLELLIVQDLYLNETAREFAHVFLPAASNFEKDGTFMNSERRIQRIRRVLAPRGEARDDGEILRRLAAAMGRAAVIPDADPETVWNEIRALWPAAAGISYARLERGGLQWPCRSETDPGLEVLHATAFAHGQKARLRPVDHRPSPETVDADYPLLLSSGRDLHQFNVGTMSGRTDQQRLRPTDTLDMNPQDAADLGLADGSEVRVESRYGSARLPLRITTMVRPGQLFVTFHDPARAVNALTGPQRDAITATPEYKLTAVRVAAADPGQA
jgi:formate dehydrogenase major subunit